MNTPNEDLLRELLDELERRAQNGIDTNSIQEKNAQLLSIKYKVEMIKRELYGEEENSGSDRG